MLLTAVVTLLVAVWVVRNYLFVSQFTPVTLSAQEERALQAKLQRLDALEAVERPAGPGKENAAEAGPLEPEPYSEEGAKREIEFTERELNALLAKNTDLAHKLAVERLVGRAEEHRSGGGIRHRRGFLEELLRRCRRYPGGRGPFEDKAERVTGTSCGRVDNNTSASRIPGLVEPLPGGNGRLVRICEAWTII